MDINSHQVCGTRSAGSSKHCGDYVLRAAPKHRGINMSKDGGFFSWGPRKDIMVFLLRMACFWRIEMGHHFLKNLPTCCFTMKVSHYRCVISQDCSSPVGPGSHHRTGAMRFASLAMPWPKPQFMAESSWYLVWKVETQELHKDKPNANRHEACCTLW